MLDQYDPLELNIRGLRKSIPSLMSKDILGVQPMSAPTGEIFTIRMSNSIAHPEPSVWFGGSSDNRTLMYPFKYGDTYLNGETYFYKIKLRGL